MKVVQEKTHIANTINSLISKNKILEFNYTDYIEDNLYNFLLNKSNWKNLLKLKVLKIITLNVFFLKI